MFLIPKKPKYNTSFSNIDFNLKSNQKIVITNGSFIILSTEFGFIASFQLDALRKNLRKLFKKTAKIYIKKMPVIPITKKPNETRLGRGKGSVKY
jgi:large subunit ribosomal protein L16